VTHFGKDRSNDLKIYISVDVQKKTTDINTLITFNF